MLRIANVLESPAWQTVLIIAGPWIVRHVWRTIMSIWQGSPQLRKQTTSQFSHRRMHAPRTAGRRDTVRACLCCVFVLFHCLYGLFYTPPNVFLSLGLPLTVPTADLRGRLSSLYASASQDTEGQVPDWVLVLVTRLSTLDNRLIYARIGHYAVSQCEFCSNLYEYMAFSTPRLVGKYVVFLVGAGSLTMSDGRERWRIWIVAIAIAGALTEIWARLDGTTPGVMVDSMAHVIRHLCFALLTLGVYYLPTYHPSPSTISSSSSSIPAATSPSDRISTPSSVPSRTTTELLHSVLQQQQRILSRLRAASLLRITALRDENLRLKMINFWEAAEQEAYFAEESPTVRELKDTIRIHGTIPQQQQQTETPLEDFVDASQRLESWIDSALEPLNDISFQ